MNNLKLNLSIKEDSSVLFKRCIRQLLDSTFIVGDKDENLFAYISRESNRHDISDYLRMIGFDLLVDTNVKIAMLRQHEADEETVGLKRANTLTFTTSQYHLLLVLWEMYLENLGYDENNIVTLGDVVDKIEVYDVGVDSSKLTEALTLFKKYNLINCDLKNRSENMPIILYPSLQFGWDIAQFKIVAAQYMKDIEEEDTLNEELLEDEREEEEYE